MENNKKTLIFRTFFLYLVFIVVGAYSCFGIGLAISFALPLLSYFIDRDFSKYSILLIPMILVSTMRSNGDFFFETIYCACIYGIRVSLKDFSWNQSKIWIFWMVLSLLIFNINYNYVFFPLVGLLITLPVYKVESDTKYLKIIRIVFVLGIFVSLIFSLGFDVLTQKRTAYLQHGNWANANVKYNINDLRNETVYSYSELVDLLNADIINNLNNINNYDELWIVTPTIPFSEKECNDIKQWVEAGGNLILVSDHTDLYGHGRCINQLIRRFGGEVGYSVSINRDNTENFYDIFHRDVILKSANSCSIFNGFPLISEYVWVEKAYYANKNNFGPVSPSGNDEYGLKTLACIKSHWLGNVTILCDSTIFANFCVFQPNISSLINQIRTFHPWGRLMLCLPFLLLLLILLFLCNEKKYYFLISSLLLTLFSYCRDSQELNWGENPQIWTGQKEYLYEGCPYSNISTAYSLSCLSGRKPKWEDCVDVCVDDVIWVGDMKPKNTRWRWIKTEDIHEEYEWNKDTMAFSELYNELKVPLFQEQTYTFDSINVRTIFNDRVMGNWWYNNGISKSRKERFESWIAWLRKEKPTSSSIYDASLFSNEKIECVLRRNKKDPVTIHIPKPIENSGEIYLGCGVSADIYFHDGQLSLIGTTQKQENSECHDLWIVDFQ